MAPRPRSITGVDVMPISGVTCPQLRSSLGTSPGNCVDVVHKDWFVLPLMLSASNAKTQPCSVATYRTFFIPTPGMGTFER